MARFLFDDRLVSRRLTAIQEKGRSIRDVRKRLGRSPDQWNEGIQDREEAAYDFLTKADEGLAAEFGRYLGFGRRWPV